jgi:glycosyltransferase involved in cell wall biosynthesis
MSPRLAVVISHPIQHFAPLFRCIAERGNVELKVFYCCDWGIKEYVDPGFGETFKWNIPLLDGYDHEFLDISSRPRNLGFRAINNPSVANRLDHFQPDAVWVHGYGHQTSWRVKNWAKKNKRKVLYFGDSELLSRRTWKQRLVKGLIVPYFFRDCDRFLTIGDNNEAYYKHYGVPEGKMIRGAFPVDIRRFQQSADSITPLERGDLQSRLGISPDSRLVLFVGKFIDIKRPLDLVEAVSRLKDGSRKIQFLFIGSGPLHATITSMIESKGLHETVKLAGFINQAELPNVLALGDILAMCSEKDPHPLVVTEAMATGNAIIASDRVGCVGPTDAAIPGVNADVYPCGDVAALEQTIRRLSEDEERLNRYQMMSRKIAWNHDVSVMANAVEMAVLSS